MRYLVAGKQQTLKQKALTSKHHHWIMLILMLITVIGGVGLGISINEATLGTQGLLIVVFALTLVNSVTSLLLFTLIMKRDNNA